MVRDLPAVGSSHFGFRLDPKPGVRVTFVACLDPQFS